MRGNDVQLKPDSQQASYFKLSLPEDVVSADVL